MNAKLIAAVIACVCLGTAMTAHAEYLYPWSVSPTISDGTDNALDGGKDILDVWFAQDSSYFYFRMDVRSAPTTVSTDYADIYGIYIDAVDGQGASSSDNTYVPSGPTGVDFILDSHFNSKGTGAWDDDHFHYDWNGTGFQVGALDGVQHSENGGTTVEWKIAKSSIGASTLTFWAATLGPGSSYATYDLAPSSAPGVTVPEPSTWVLAASGLLLLVLSVRRRR